MSHIDNLDRILSAMADNDRAEAQARPVVMTGVIGQFSLAFEQAWKALQEALREEGISEFELGSPKEVLVRAHSINWIQDEETWLEMLKQRNTSIHVYDAQATEQLVDEVFDRFVPALAALHAFLRDRHEDGAEN